MSNSNSDAHSQSTSSSGQQPSECSHGGEANSGVSVSPTIDVGGVSPAINVGDVNVSVCLSDTADVLPGSSVLNDVIDAGGHLSDVADVGLGGAMADGLLGALTDADVGAAIAHLTDTIGGTDVLPGQLDLADVGAILGNDCIADLVGDTVLDGLVTHANLLDIPDLGGLFGDHA